MFVYFMVDEIDASSVCLICHEMYSAGCCTVVILFVVTVLFLWLHSWWDVLIK